KQPNPRGNKAFTVGVKKALEEIGKKKNFETICTNQKASKKEFMLDVVWWARTPEGEWPAMGAESEWGNPRSKDVRFRANQVAEDFEKLLCFKAPLKLLFFSAENRRMRDVTHAEIIRYLRHFAHHVAGEEYLFMEFSQNDSGQLECYSHTWKVDSDGRCPNASLVPLDEKSAKVLRQGMATGA